MFLQYWSLACFGQAFIEKRETLARGKLPDELDGFRHARWTVEADPQDVAGLEEEGELESAHWHSVRQPFVENECQ